MATIEIEIVNNTGDLQQIRLRGTADGSRLLTKDEIEALLGAIGTLPAGTETFTLVFQGGQWVVNGRITDSGTVVQIGDGNSWLNINKTSGQVVSYTSDGGNKIVYVQSSPSTALASHLIQVQDGGDTIELAITVDGFMTSGYGLEKQVDDNQLATVGYVNDSSGGGIPSGTALGQILRWNNTTMEWEICPDIRIYNGDIRVNDSSGNTKAKLYEYGGDGTLELTDNGGYLQHRLSTDNTHQSYVAMLASNQFGVGTTSPNAKLHVAKHIATSPQLLLKLENTYSIDGWMKVWVQYNGIWQAYLGNYTFTGNNATAFTKNNDAYGASGIIQQNSEFYIHGETLETPILYADTDTGMSSSFKRIQKVDDIAFTTSKKSRIIHVTHTPTASVTITLGSDALDGQELTIKDAGGNAGTNNITIVTEGSETIDGTSTQIVNSDYGEIDFYFYEGNWWIS